MEDIIKNITLIITTGSSVILGINFYNSVKTGKKRDAEHSNFIDKQNKLLEQFSDSFKLVCKETTGLNEDARRIIKNLELHFDTQINSLKDDVQSINQDIKKIYSKLS